MARAPSQLRTRAGTSSTGFFPAPTIWHLDARSCIIQQFGWAACKSAPMRLHLLKPANTIFQSDCIQMPLINSVNDVISPLGHDYKVALRPDHPFLAIGPDIIVGGQGALVAILIPKVSEIRMPHELLVRLAFGRLALPAHTRFVLVLEHRSIQLGNPKTSIPISFDAVFTEKKMQGLVKFISSQDSAVTHFGEKILEVQHRQYSRATTFFVESRHALSAERKTSNTRAVLSDIRGSLEYTPPTWAVRATGPSVTRKPRSRQRQPPLIRSGDVVLGAVNFARNGSPMQTLRKFCSIGIQTDYMIDNGIPYLRDANLKFLITNTPPTGRLDPSKPLRAAAFAGWIVTQADSARELEDFTDSIRSRLD